MAPLPSSFPGTQVTKQGSLAVLLAVRSGREAEVRRPRGGQQACLCRSGDVREDSGTSSPTRRSARRGAPATPAFLQTHGRTRREEGTVSVPRRVTCPKVLLPPSLAADQVPGMGGGCRGLALQPPSAHHLPPPPPPPPPYAQLAHLKLNSLNLPWRPWLLGQGYGWFRLLSFRSFPQQPVGPIPVAARGG